MNSDHIIEFSRDVGFTIVYSDSHGRVLFPFEIDPDTRRLALSGRGLIDNKLVGSEDGPSWERVQMASALVKAYLSQKGRKGEPETTGLDP